MLNTVPTQQDIESAHHRIRKYIHKTPILTSASLNKMFGCKFYFKCENFQRAGAFKMRGATNAILSLSPGELKKGVATHSSGNHAGALSLAAKILNTTAYIAMPHTAPKIKRLAVEGYGGKITFCEPTLDDREKTLIQIIRKTGSAIIHPFDDYNVIAGHASCAKEIFEDFSDINFILAPIGGGGLLSGTSLSTKFFSKKTKVIGVEPKGADDAFRSIRDGKIYPSINPQTIADGLLTSLSQKTFKIIQENVSEILTVSEESILEAMYLVWERMKIIIEPSSATVLAAVIENVKKFKNAKVALIFSGGNLDLKKL